MWRSYLGESESNPDWRGQFSILNDEAGVPYVDQQGHGRLPLSLSISHREDCGLAAIALVAGARIGADIETVEPRDPALVRQFFSESEAAWVAGGGDVDRTVARIWSAKEAVLKAIGIGLRHDTRDIVVGDESGRTRSLGGGMAGAGRQFGASTGGANCAALTNAALPRPRCACGDGGFADVSGVLTLRLPSQFNQHGSSGYSTHMYWMVWPA